MKNNILPITEDPMLRKWSYLYAFNLKVIRDIFVYCAQHGQVDEEKIYDDMKELKIPPPKDYWINIKRKRQERLRLEYLHAAEYLGFINKRERIFYPNFAEFKKEKISIISENKERTFNPKCPSAAFTQKERESLLKIVLNYRRAMDFLRWFLNLRKFPENRHFTYEEFRKNAEPIYLLGKVDKKERGSKVLKREIDGKIWAVPNKYTRLASYVFPSWFIDLGLIDKVVVFPEFSDDKNLWHMMYPLRMENDEFIKLNIPKLIMKMFLNQNRKECTVWIPYLIYMLAKTFRAPVEGIKLGIEKACKSKPSSFYLERIPAHLMKSRLTYKHSYIEVDGFFRSHIKIIGGH